MCGIIGFVGNEPAAPILLDGLERMEYRGYDSAGVAVRSETAGLQVRKTKGRLQVLSAPDHGGADLEGNLGIGHTRWATHGEPNDINAHPHVSENGRIALVHNGIIENYLEIKEHLMRQGVHFTSDTDTEVVAQLLEFHYNECHNMLEAVGRCLRRIGGVLRLRHHLCGLPQRPHCRPEGQPPHHRLRSERQLHRLRRDGCHQVHPGRGVHGRWGDRCPHRRQRGRV